MSTIILDDCLRELYEAERCLSEYKELDSYLEIFEADNPEVQAQDATNKKAKVGVLTHLKNAAKAVLKMIQDFIHNIQDFFAKRKMSEEQRKAYEDFKIAAKNDPSLKNKKITVRDFTKIQNEYKSLINEAEKMDRELAAGKQTDCSALMDKITKFIGGSAKGVAVAVGCEAALNIASSSTEMAQMFLKGLKNDEKIQEALISAIGEKETAKFEKDMAALGKRISLKRIVMKMKGRVATSVQEGIENTISQVADLCSNGLNVAIAFAGKDPNVEKNAFQRGVENTKFVFKNRDKFANASKSAARNSGLVSRIMSNDQIKSSISAASKVDKNAQKMGTDWFANNRQADFEDKLSSLTKGHDKIQDQSAMASLLGLNAKKKQPKKRFFK